MNLNNKNMNVSLESENCSLTNQNNHELASVAILPNHSKRLAIRQNLFEHLLITTLQPLQAFFPVQG